MNNIRRLLTLLAACFSLSVLAQTPEGEPASTDMEILQKRAEEGDIEAMNYLGYLLISGSEGVEKDPDEGLIWLSRAAGAGDVKAASNLGWLYLQGGVVERNAEEAVKWLSQAAAARLPVAQSILGDLYRDGLGVEKNSETADSLYLQAFENGLGDAGYKLYALNADNYARLSPSEKVKIGKYYYFSSIPSEGVKLFYQAAEEGNAEAMALLGDAYTRAIGVPYDHNLSKKYYVEAARAGNPSAMFVVAELLDIFPDALKGNADWEGLPDDPSYWYAKAAEGGVTDSATASNLLFK